VHAAHPHVQGVAGGVSVDDHGHIGDDFVDRLGHGTAVAAVIREKAPDAELFAVKVFDRHLSATAQALCVAIRWARLVRVNIINLSLGTANPDHEAALATEVDAAIQARIVVVAAGPTAAERWLPGALRGVVRVALDMSLPRDQWRAAVSAGGEVEIAASGYPRPIPGVPPEKNLRGLSFAVANATGFIARAWPQWDAALLPRPDKSP
jgi:subtilisin family serine protease